ncbi:MAG: hypothetical protein KGM24_00170, partial [Elusimicrobia bacterium]|nr:hypothetical protein [Elusimicrobiota bacterium]
GTVRADGGAGGTGGTDGGGGGGGGRVWLRESGPSADVFHSSVTVSAAAGTYGGGASFGVPGSSGSRFEDPRHWTAAGGNSLASNAANWSQSLLPLGGERLVFGAEQAALGCVWDLGGVAVGSASFTAAFSSSVALAAPLSVSGSLTLAGGTLDAPTAGLDLSVGGAFSQTGGSLDLWGSTLTLASPASAQSASFFSARVSSLTIGGLGASTVTLSGALEVQSAPLLSASATLSLSSASLTLDGAGPFAGAGSVDSDSSSVVAAGGSSTQTWTAWPGRIGGLRVENASAGGLILSTSSGTGFAMAGGVQVDTGDAFAATGASLRVGGNWAVYGTANVAGSTVDFTGGSGTQTVSGAASFDALTIDEGSAALRLSTGLVVASTVSVLSGTLDLSSMTLHVRGGWSESAGAVVLGGTSVAIFDGSAAEVVRQVAGNSFATFVASSTVGVRISSTLATSAGFEWRYGDLDFSGASLTFGGDVTLINGNALTVTGSTAVFDGSVAQTVRLQSFGRFVDANTSAGGVAIALPLTVESFKVEPGSLFDGSSYAMTVTGSSFDTAGSTYVATSLHSATLSPVGGTVTIAAGSVVSGKLTIAAGKTADLLGDLTVSGAAAALVPGAGATIVNAAGGSTITFAGSAELAPAAGGDWTYGGDAARSWLVYAGSGTARGASISTNTLGSLRVDLDASTEVFKAPTMSLSGSLLVQGGTLRPSGAATISVGGDLLQTGGALDFASVATGTFVLTGPSTQTVSALAGSTLWHLTDLSTAAVQAASDLTMLGDFQVRGGTFAAGAGQLTVAGNLLVSTGAWFDGQTSTVSLAGGDYARTTQSLSVWGGGAFDGLRLYVSNASVLTPATATVLTDAYPNGALTVAAGSQLTVDDLRLGVSGSTLTVASTIGGTPWKLDVLSVSSVTAATVSDSDASPGRTVLADDALSTDAGGNTNWKFHPNLLVLLPGETPTFGVAPGKTGTPQISTAGAATTATVYAVSSLWNLAATATGTVTLASDDPYATYGPAQALSGGSATLTFTPRAAEPAPLATHVTAKTFFATGVSTASVVPTGLSALQIVLPGESAAPGSSGGVSGTPFPRVSGVAFSATVRAVDPYWNLISTAADSFALATTASSATLPTGLSLSGGQTSVSGIVVYSTGLYALSASDLTEPGVAWATSSVFGVTPPSVSSPTAAFYVPTGASIATLGGVVAGTAADSASIALVRVEVRDVDAARYYDWGAQSFTSLVPFYTTSTLAAPLAPSTTWSSPIPDTALVDGHRYAADALVSDPSGFVGTASSTFSVDLSALSYGAGDGQGAASASPASAPGCEVRTTTIAFTVGAAGISPGGAVAVRVPPGWSVPLGTAPAPPPAGYWSAVSTSAAMAWAAASVNPAASGSQTLGDGWLLLTLSTAAPVSFSSGTEIDFRYTGLPPLSPQGRGAQTFAVRARAGASGLLAPISTQPYTTLGAGTTAYLAFSDPSPLSLGPLQESATMSLKIVDLCGNDDLGVSSGPVALSLAVPAGGSYATDASAAFHAVGGSTIATVQMSTGVSYSPSFSVDTATSGPTLAYVVASATFTHLGPPIATVAMRAVSLEGSTVAFTAVSIDTGTLSPGTTSVTLDASAPDAYAARAVFTLPGGTPWQATIAPESGAVATPVLRASGTGDPTRAQTFSWDGVDRVSDPPRFAPAGRYRVSLDGGGAASDESLEVVVPPTAGYVGRLGPAGAGDVVRAVGPGAGDGAYAVATSTGWFQLSGLRLGQAYQVLIATTQAVGGTSVVLSTALAAPAAALPPA